MLYQFSVFLLIIAISIPFGLYYFENIPAENQHWNIIMAAEAENHRASLANQSCFVLGYTGEVGKALVTELLTNKLFQNVVLIGRRKVEYEEAIYKDVEQRVIDYDALENHKDAFSGFDQGFCCLGTTRAKAGAEGFVKVDHDYVVNTAQLAKDGGTRHFHLVTSMGSDKNSSMLYPKTKGQAEADCTTLGFDQISIYRPGLLMCDRQESRVGERVLRALFRPIAAMFPTSGSIPTTVVATGMINMAAAPKDKDVNILENKAIHQIAGNAK